MDRTYQRKNKCCFWGLTLGAVLWIGGCQSSNPSPFPDDPWNTDPTTQKAYSIISTGLTDKNPRVRTSAIETIASSRLLNYAPQLLYLLRDRNQVTPMRFAVLVALGDLQYRQAMNTCQQIYQGPQENANIKLAAAYALVRVGQSGYLTVLRQGLTHTQPEIRSNAAFLIGKAGDQEALDQLHHILVSPDLDEQTTRQIIDTIAQLRDNRIYQTLWSRLISLFADDRIQGIRGMGQLGHNQAQKAIQTMLDDDIPEVRLAAAEELARLGDLRGEATVLEILKKQLNTRVSPHQSDDAERVRLHVMAALAIGALDTEATRRYLPKLMGDTSSFVRIAAARAVLRKQFQWQR